MANNIWIGGEDQENMDIDGEQQEGAAVAARRRKKVRARCGVSRNDHGSPSILASDWNLYPITLNDLMYFAIEKECKV